MKIQNERARGGARPIHVCKCGALFNTQARGRKPVANGVAYCSTSCPYAPKIDKK